MSWLIRCLKYVSATRRLESKYKRRNETISALLRQTSTLDNSPLYSILSFCAAAPCRENLVIGSYPISLVYTLHVHHFSIFGGRCPSILIFGGQLPPPLCHRHWKVFSYSRPSYVQIHLVPVCRWKLLLWSRKRETDTIILPFFSCDTATVTATIVGNRCNEIKRIWITCAQLQLFINNEYT